MVILINILAHVCQRLCIVAKDFLFGRDRSIILMARVSSHLLQMFLKLFS